MCLDLEPVLPLIPVSGHTAWHDKLMLRVGLTPLINCKPVQVLRALAVGERELKKSVLSLWPQNNELGQTLHLKILAHKEAVLQGAVNVSHDVVQLARYVVEYPG